MSFGFRDKDRPSLRDRFRGKSGDQILEELRKKLDKDKEMFFERAPNPPSFRRAGFPFDDDGLTSRGRPDFRHRLEELAQQHPEFADSLRPWYEQQQQQSPQHAAGDAGWGFRQRTGSNTSQSHPEPQQQQHPPPQQQQQPEAKCEQQQQQPQQQQPQPGLAHHGLRNTVDLGEAKAQAEAQGAQAMDGQGQDERGKRAQSAPPAPEQAGHGGHPQRFVSRLDINPQPTAAAGQQASQDPAAAKPPSGPKPQPQAAKAGSSSSNVRQIPIFVEGRDEPVMAKDEVDSSAANFGQGFTHHPPPRSGFGQPFSRHNMGFPSWREQNQEREAPQQKRPFPQQQPQPQPPTRQQYQQPQQQQPPPQQQHHQPPPQKQQPPRQQTPPQQPPPQHPPPPSKPKDALDKVHDVRVEVESLSKQVDEFVGTAKDKAYIFLDEMLTRELIKLDVIEAEGRDDVRQARKDTIRFIQQCISRLEAKAAQPAAAAPAEAMDVDPAAASQSDKTEGAEAAPEAAAQAEASPSSAAESQPAAPAQPAEAAAAPSQPDAVPAPSPAPSTATGNADTTQAPPAATS